MGGGLEEAGALGMAAATAQAIDGPGAGGSVNAEGHEDRCLNCEAALAGPYCAACGQKAHLHRSLLHAVEEFLHGIVHFDSRFWNTLPLLVFRPGKLTRDYVMGKRARYIAPVAVFLLTVFTMFLLFAFLPAPGMDMANTALSNSQKAVAEAEIRDEISAVDKRIAEAEAALAASPGDKKAASRLLELKATRTLLEKGEAQVKNDEAAPGGDSLYDVMRRAAASKETNFDVGDPSMEKKLRTAFANPEFVAYKMKQKGYKLSFLLVPLSLPWLMLMFAWKRGVKTYDHVVFLLYSISFMSMLAMIASLLAAAGVGSGFVYGLLLVFIPLAHMFLQLKEGYALGWFSAAWRTFALAITAIITLAIYVVGIALLGLLD